MTSDVQAWAETVTLPTYRIGEPDKNPLFLENRVYQGSSGVVYPYPVVERVFDEKVDQTYTAIFLENRYLKLMILPELGGRLHRALDKTNGYDFVYHNRVIKPALVGLTGPWISGGIEFNWPQHHRPTTFEPVDWQIEAHDDGSCTVWCGEIERMFRTQGVHGFTLHPDRAYVDINVQLYNRTSEPQTFLWWANPAVAVNDDYQSIFPPDVHAVMDHGKRDVSTFPIATGTYYKVDYAPGTDISRYKNIPVPTSYMAYHSDFDFVGCYDHGRRAGMMHVANHHIVPGKKQWTWGNGDFGQRWDRHLTDEDGPYIELMCGAYTDNQPDFSWLLPGEEKRFTQTFLPYKTIVGVKNASKEVLLNLDVSSGEAALGVYVTQPRRVEVLLLNGNERLYRNEVELSPERALTTTVPLAPGTPPQSLALRVLADGREILAFSPLPDEKPAIPAPATAAEPPAAIESVEELFLNGLHLEQYRHATYAPEPYYREALRRDPGHSRANNALGLLLYRRGKFAAAEPYFRRAVERLTLRNPNPRDGEPFYNLGLSLAMQARYNEAFDAFYKATWNGEWSAAAYFELARLASRAGRRDEALDLVRRSLATNGRHHKARHLEIALLRHLGRDNDARAAVNASLRTNRLNYGALWERQLLADESRIDDSPFARHTRLHPDTLLEVALDYAHAGLFDDAVRLLEPVRHTQPMVDYTLGWIHEQAGRTEQALAAFQSAAQLPPDRCFPNRLEDVLALTEAMAANPNDARAPYYLGNFWYAHRRYDEAIEAWEASRALDDGFPTVQRNLGLAYYNKRRDPERALKRLEHAFVLDPCDARVLFELDQLHKKRNRPPAERLALLDRHLELVEQRDDLALERISLFNLLGRPDDALRALTERTFHPWEGGEGKVTRQYVLSLVEIARHCIEDGELDDAIEHLQRARRYPPNLGEGKLHGTSENNIFYYLGRAHEALGAMNDARAWYERATAGLSEPTSAVFYNDQPPDAIFYRGLAHQRLGHVDEARAIFRGLVDYGLVHMEDEVTIDYFAISLPTFLVFDEDLNQRNRIHCHYIAALGYTGLEQEVAALARFDAVLQLDANHLGAVLHRPLLPTVP